MRIGFSGSMHTSPAIRFGTEPGKGKSVGSKGTKTGIQIGDLGDGAPNNGQITHKGPTLMGDGTGKEVVKPTSPNLNA